MTILASQVNTSAACENLLWYSEVNIVLLLVYSFYACHHCYSVEGLSWHHAGPDKSILCDECRVHFKNYGFMRPLTGKIASTC